MQPSRRATIIPGPTLESIRTPRLPTPSDVRGYLPVVAQLDRDAREDGRATMRCRRFSDAEVASVHAAEDAAGVAA